MAGTNKLQSGDNDAACALQVSGASHTGLIRKRNEDAIAIAAWQSPPEVNSTHEEYFLLEKPVLLAVADGLGGHKAGNVASQYVLRRLIQTGLSEDFQQQVEQAIRAIEDGLQQEMQSSPELNTMGSTLAGVIISGLRLFHFNIGDSRIYLHSRGRLSRLSVDDKDVFTKHLSRALGGRAGKSEPPFPHVGHVDLQSGDSLLICSDGLTDLFEDIELGGLLSVKADKTADDFVIGALERGAHDNVSVIVARISF
jgi:serine/threonine protein phosphatase PrpC